MNKKHKGTIKQHSGEDHSFSLWDLNYPGRYPRMGESLYKCTCSWLEWLDNDTLQALGLSVHSQSLPKD